MGPGSPIWIYSPGTHLLRRSVIRWIGSDAGSSRRGLSRGGVSPMGLMGRGPWTVRRRRFRSLSAPRPGAQVRKSLMAAASLARLACVISSRYSTRPCCQSSTRDGASQSMPTSTSIALTNCRSTRGAPAALTTLCSTWVSLFCVFAAAVLVEFDGRSQASHPTGRTSGTEARSG